ncbi:DUF3450 family protein [Sulfurimonas sp.]
MIYHHTKILSTLAISFTLYSPLLQATSTDELAKSIINLRGDVENLYSQVKENKQKYHAQMKSLSMQSIDLQAQINRKQTSLKLANNELKKIKQKIQETSNGNKEIKPLVLKSLKLLEVTIQEGIPFMVQERINSLHKIKSDLNAGLITNEKALALTWASYDDAIRTTKEIGLFKQQIEFKGQKVLARIAKLGSVALFFSTPKDEVGYVIKKDTGYEYKHITDPKDIEKIVALFDALQKQIRTGFFELPNALVLQGSN